MDGGGCNGGYWVESGQGGRQRANPFSESRDNRPVASWNRIEDEIELAHRHHSRSSMPKPTWQLPRLPQPEPSPGRLQQQEQARLYAQQDSGPVQIARYPGVNRPAYAGDGSSAVNLSRPHDYSRTTYRHGNKTSNGMSVQQKLFEPLSAGPWSVENQRGSRPIQVDFELIPCNSPYESYMPRAGSYHASSTEVASDSSFGVDGRFTDSSMATGSTNDLTRSLDTVRPDSQAPVSNFEPAFNANSTQYTHLKHTTGLGSSIPEETLPSQPPPYHDQDYQGIDNVGSQDVFGRPPSNPFLPLPEAASARGSGSTRSSPVQSSLSTSNPEILTCTVPRCRAKFSGAYARGNRGRHMRQKHGGSQQDSQPRVVYCEEPGCQKNFQRQDARTKHYRKHHPHRANAFVPRKLHVGLSTAVINGAALNPDPSGLMESFLEVGDNGLLDPSYDDEAEVDGSLVEDIHQDHQAEDDQFDLPQSLGRSPTFDQGYY